jgi:hypothetical protein
MLMMTRKVLAIGVGVLAVTSGSMPEADAQNACDENAKEEIAKLLTHPVIVKSPGSKEALELEEQIAAKYSACAPEPVDVSKLPPEVTDGYCGSLSYLGNTSYEEMRCCGYDPQKRLSA